MKKSTTLLTGLFIIFCLLLISCVTNRKIIDSETKEDKLQKDNLMYQYKMIDQKVSFVDPLNKKLFYYSEA